MGWRGPAHQGGIVGDVQLAEAGVPDVEDGQSRKIGREKKARICGWMLDDVYEVGGFQVDEDIRGRKPAIILSWASAPEDLPPFPQ
jgi:hypothetical protein